MPSTVPCSQCGYPLAVEHCPHCEPAPAPRKLWTWDFAVGLAILLSLLVLWGIAWYISRQHTERGHRVMAMVSAR